MTHRASGFLHSIDSVSPSDDLIAAVKPQTFRDRPDFGGQGNTGGMFAQYQRLEALGVKHFQIVLSDGFNGDYAGPYPGDDGTYLAWENYVTNLVLRVKTANMRVEYDIWNEPDIGYFWRRDAATLRETWKRAVNRIRLLDPGATIVGPSFASYGDGLKNFLLNAKADNVLPDVVAWHEFGSSFTSRVSDARAFMAANEMNIDRISLNEIVGTANFDGAPQWQNAGPLPRYFRNIEVANIESAAHACWGGEAGGGDNCENGSLNGLLTSDTKVPRSTYWVYERYARMSGTVAGFTQGVVRNAAGLATFDGLATRGDGVAHVLFGRTRDTDGSDAEVKLTNLDHVANLLGRGAVRVTGEAIANTTTAASAGPVVVYDRITRVAGGEALVPVRQFGNSDAYFLTVQAVPSWARGGDGTWSDGSAWHGGTVPDGAGAAAYLGPADGGVRPAVSVDSPRTLGLLTLDNPSGYRITGGSGTLTMDNGPARAVIEAAAGFNELDAAVRVAPGAVLDVVVGDGATLKLGAGNRLRVGALDIHPSGTLDLGTNNMIIDYSGASPGGIYEALIASGYNVTGHWLGNGITSSIAAVDGNYVVAIADNALLPAPFGSAQGGPLFSGVDVDLTTILIKFTHRADINLDGVMSPDDSAVFGGNYDEGQPARWTTGDMNYDGVFTPDDAAIFGGAYDESLASLPEPACLGMFGASGLALWNRSRRRR